ncbi:hypothetical protein [Neisseria dumasiana]|uniref:hypothetical protein n=1 Tax=Neisseria dumasiana TaxID=1931275 RepID=UPI000A19512C|nr:hypothetical protein [Neisseria dumasiana]
MIIKKIIYIAILSIPLLAYPSTYKGKNTNTYIKIKHLKNGNNILFNIYSSSNGKRSELIKGVAKLKPGDVETESEPNSMEVYEVNEYIYDQKNCYILMRIETENGKRGSLFTECPKKKGLRNLEFPILKIK